MDADELNEVALVASAAMMRALTSYGEMADLSAYGLPIAPELRRDARAACAHGLAKLEGLTKALRQFAAEAERQFDAYDKCARALAERGGASVMVN